MMQTLNGDQQFVCIKIQFICLVYRLDVRYLSVVSGADVQKIGAQTTLLILNANSIYNEFVKLLTLI